MPLGSPAARRYKGTKIEIHGVPAVRAALNDLAATHGKSVERALSKRALRAMLKPVTAAIKRDAPTQSKFRMTGKRKKKPAPVRSIRKAVAGRLIRNKRKNIHEAKAGLNVTKPKAKQFRFAAIYTVGTKRRATRAGLNRGRIRQDRFVINARVRSQAAASQAGLFAVRSGLPAEVEKVRKRHAKRAAAESAKHA